MPGMQEELERKRKFRGLPAVKEMVPKKMCGICGRGFDYTSIQGPLPEMDTCKKCKEKLAEGYTALISDNRFAFIKSASLIDQAGKIMNISPNVMEAVQKQHIAEWIEREEPTNEAPEQGQNPQSN